MCLFLIFYYNSKQQKAPEYLSDCTKIDSTSSELFDWSERVDRWARSVLWFNILGGLLSGLITLCIDENLWWIALTIVFACVIGGIVSYLLLHIISVLISALASIVNNTGVSARVALLEASVNPEIPKEKPSAPTPSYKKPPSSKAQATKRVCFCGKCGVERHVDDEFCPNCQSTMKCYKDIPV